jgi:hypothetical protein
MVKGKQRRHLPQIRIISPLKKRPNNAGEEK